MYWSKIQWDRKISICSIVQGNNSHSIKYNVWLLFFWKDATKLSTSLETGFSYRIFLEGAHSMATIGCGACF